MKNLASVVRWLKRGLDHDEIPLESGTQAIAVLEGLEAALGELLPCLVTTVENAALQYCDICGEHWHQDDPPKHEPDCALGAACKFLDDVPARSEGGEAF